MSRSGHVERIAAIRNVHKFLVRQLGREDIFKLAIGNGSLYEINNENGARVVNFTALKVSKEDLGYYQLKQQIHGLMKSVQNY
jgi:hypothetical protein